MTVLFRFRTTDCLNNNVIQYVQFALTQFARHPTISFISKEACGAYG